MTRRYFASPLPVHGGIVTLDSIESHHATNVMRSKVGESITIFDGIGNQCSATIESVGRRDVVCRSEPLSKISRENRVVLTLGVAMPKGDRSKELVERLTELGVNRLVPLNCKRSQWPVPDNAIAKWQRVVIDACKQSQRNHLMEIVAPQSLATWLTTNNEPKQVSRFIAHPLDEHELTPWVVTQADGLSTEIHGTIGPEGGFSDDEITMADQRGWKRMSLGNRIYRIETAAILAAIKLAGL